MIRTRRQSKALFLICLLLLACFANWAMACPPDPPDCSDCYEINWWIDVMYPSTCIGCTGVDFITFSSGWIACECVSWWSSGVPSYLGSSCVYNPYWTSTGEKWVTATLSCGEYKDATINVARVAKIVEEGTNDEGPLYVCLEDTVSLEGKPDAGHSLPCEVEWTVVDHPVGADPWVEPGSNTRKATAGGFTEAGDYEFKARTVGCNGYKGSGDTITVTAD